MPRNNSNRSRVLSQRSQIQPQQQPKELETNLNISEQVNDLVRYFVNRAGEHVSFKRAELKKNVLPKVGQQFQDVLDQAVKVLKEVYGYNVIVVDAAQNASKGYIVTNSLPYIADPTEVVSPDEYPEDVNKILMMLILSHIFMSNNAVNESSLYSFLKSLDIDVDRKHEMFGNVKDFISGTLKNKKYINMEMDQMSKKITFSWGSRAEKEISKHEILKFVCKLYKTLPTSWISQYKAANEQHFENQQAMDMVGQATQNTQE